MTTETALTFACGRDSIVAIHHRGDGRHDVGVVVVIGGPQYRVGSHRQFVLLARAVARAGYAVLRFDVRGMGDSSGDSRTFRDIDDDIVAAVDALQRCDPTVRRVVLWGLCDAASAVLLHWHGRQDPRLAGLCLANPWVRTAPGLARIQVRHYYLRRLKEREFWRKLLSGRVAATALRSLWGNLLLARSGSTSEAAESFQGRMASAWQRFPGPLLLILSGNDYTAKEFVEYVARGERWSRALERAQLTRFDVTNADHTFSDPQAQSSVERQTVAWLDALASEPRRLETAAVPGRTTSAGRTAVSS